MYRVHERVLWAKDHYGQNRQRIMVEVRTMISAFGVLKWVQLGPKIQDF